jgi:hypothetical protein
MPYRPAFECRCPDKDCTGWRKSASLGGGHITRVEAIKLIAQAREQRTGHG